MIKDKFTFYFVILILIMGLSFIAFKLKCHHDEAEKLMLANEIQKTSQSLMVDLILPHSISMITIPVDGQWHSNLTYTYNHQIVLQYKFEDNHLIRTTQSSKNLVADDISFLRLRRQRLRPDIVEIEIQAKNNISMFSYLKVRLSQ